MKRKTRQCGVTLIELLTVILIMLVLTAILFPVFFQVKARARQTVCESNMHQVYLAIQLYENDYGVAPYLSSSDPDWTRQYLGNTVLKCSNSNHDPASWDYFVSAGFLDDEATNSQSLHWNNLLRECHDKRGDSFPFAFDPNHRGKRDAYQAAGRRVILVRASGSVANVPYRDVPFQGNRPDWAPCSLELFPELQF